MNVRSTWRVVAAPTLCSTLESPCHGARHGTRTSPFTICCGEPDRVHGCDGRAGGGHVGSFCHHHGGPPARPGRPGALHGATGSCQNDTVGHDGPVRRASEVVRTDPWVPALDVVARAGRVLAGGGLVVLPTETVYGLGADALDPVAVRAVFSAKGRPATDPLIVHLADPVGVDAVVASWPDEAERLAAQFWPGRSRSSYPAPLPFPTRSPQAARPWPSGCRRTP